MSKFYSFMKTAKHGGDAPSLHPDAVGGRAEEQSSEQHDSDSQASYIYNSGDSSADGSKDERDYFGDSISVEESGESDAAWIDSDEDEDLRDDYTGAAAWLTTEGLPRHIQRKARRISFRLSRNIFAAKYRIKLFKSYGDLKIAVDTFNIIYLIKEFDDYKAYKLDRFRVSDAVLFNNRILLSSDSCAFLKAVSLDGGTTTINKRTGNVRRMCAGDSLYIAGTQLFRFDRSLNLKDVFNQKFADICVSATHVLGLKEDGDVFAFDLRLNFLKRYSYPGKFQFRNIHCTDAHYYIGTDVGFSVLNEHFELVKEFTNIKCQAAGLVFNKDFTVYGADHTGSLRIIKAGLAPYDRFPFSKVRIAPIAALGIEGDTVYLSHSRFLSSLKLCYVQP